MILHLKRLALRSQCKVVTSHFRNVSKRNFSVGTPQDVLKSKMRSKQGESKDQHLDDVLKIIRMVRDTRRGGHFVATLDPLSSSHEESSRRSRMSTDSTRLPTKKEEVANTARFFGLDRLPLDEPYYLGGEIRNADKVEWTIKELIHHMNDCYCGNVGVEIQHMENAKERLWLQELVEGEFGSKKWNLSSPAEQRFNFTKLLESDHTSAFLGEKFHFTKIFELEGAESLLPGLWAVLTEFSKLGGEAIEMGEKLSVSFEPLTSLIIVLLF